VKTNKQTNKQLKATPYVDVVTGVVVVVVAAVVVAVVVVGGGTTRQLPDSKKQPGVFLQSLGFNEPQF
jgi:hypothetical protein